MSAVGWAL